MKKIISVWMSILMGLSLSLPVYADDACPSVFQPPIPPPAVLIGPDVVLDTVRLVQDNAPTEVTSRRDPRFRPALHRLIRMLADTGYINRVRDDVLERGEMRLGYRLASGVSVELKYVLDQRNGGMVFHLNSVSMSKPNGINISIDKNPVSDDGRVLTGEPVIIGRHIVNEGLPNQYAASDVLAPEQRQSENTEDQARLTLALSEAETFQVPVEIKGPLLASLLPWLDRVPHLSRSEIREALDRNQTQFIIWKARFKGLLSEMSKIARKQTLKYMMLGGVLLGFTYFSTIQMTTDTTSIDQPPTVEDVLNEQASSHPPLQGEEKTPEEIDRMVNELRALETRETKIYFGNSSAQAWEYMPVDTMPSQVMRQGYLIIELEAQNKMIIIANSSTGGRAISILDRTINADQIAAFHRMLLE